MKTWAMRGMLHLLPAVEFPMWQAALSTYGHYLQIDGQDEPSAGVAPSSARIDELGEEAAPVEVEGTRAWMLTGDVPRLVEVSATRSIRLLPAFDQYVVGAPRNVPALLPAVLKPRIYRSAGWISPVVLVDGRMDGVWTHERRGKRVAVRIEPFVNLPAWARRAAEAEAERLAFFFGSDLDLTWTD